MWFRVVVKTADQKGVYRHASSMLVCNESKSRAIQYVCRKLSIDPETRVLKSSRYILKHKITATGVHDDVAMRENGHQQLAIFGQLPRENQSTNEEITDEN